MILEIIKVLLTTIPVLNYDESVLIFSNVTATVKFIQSLEGKHRNKTIIEATPDWDSF